MSDQTFDISQHDINLKNIIRNPAPARFYEDVSTVKDKAFGFEIPEQCPGISSQILLPHNTWDDPEVHDKEAKKLGHLFTKNFEKFKKDSSKEIAEAGPIV